MHVGDTSENSKVGILRAEWLIPLMIFMGALAVRLAFVWQVKGSPYWRVPLVDAMMYDRLAMDLLHKSWLAPLPSHEMPYTPYYQPPLYQAFLALVYLVFGHSPVRAYIIQHVIGAFSCVLVYLIARRAFGRSAGILAGLGMALTAPMIFYEGRLLPPVLSIFLNLAAILLAGSQIRSPARWRWPVIGILIGLSTNARPEIMLFVPLLLVWMWLERKTLLPGRPGLWMALLALCAVLPVGLVTLRNQVVGHDLVLLSSNGGINVFIGNNPEMERLALIRPGIEWESLTYLPMKEAGVVRPSQWSLWFCKAGLRMMWQHKRMALRNLATKFMWIWQGPESALNLDDYYFCRLSSVYRLLLWRNGGFGFPFGVIAPLGLLGMVLYYPRKREHFLLYAYVGTEVLMMVMFWPNSRYRAPLVPVLIIFAAGALVQVVSMVRTKGIGEAFVPLVLLVSFTFFSMACPPRFKLSPAQNEAENYRMLATALSEEDRLDEAIQTCEKGIRLSPNDPDLYQWMREAYVKAGDLPRAAVYGRECVRLAPGYPPGYSKLAEIYEALGRPDEARRVLRSMQRPH